MGGDASAFAVLGLEPGADSAAVERAYKRLIKQHHPDREGGDSKRAAELNHAYREIRAMRPRDALELHHHQYFEPRTRNFWVGFVLGLAGAVAAMWILTGPLAPMIQSPHLPLTQAAAAIPVDAMEQPLNLPAVDGSVRDALHIARTQDEMRLAAASQACNHKLRMAPSVAQLDRCAAFDDAVVQLQDRDPLRDRGPFSELAVTGRQWSGASALSNDYLAIDGRLDRVRLRVEMALTAQGAFGN
jgi:hypothetical protein